MRVLLWGTYDVGKPRVRLLLRGLETQGIEVQQIHSDVWHGIEDKSQVKGIGARMRLLGRWLLSYPALVWRYLRAPAHDVVLIGYLGLLDVLVLWPFARLKGKPLVLDAFLSIYNTVVEDRALIGKANPIAWLIWLTEWIAYHAANHLITDTSAHGRYFIDTYHLKEDKVGRVFVGVEPEIFHTSGEPAITKSTLEQSPPSVLFYGQFIPLHGIATIIEAARHCAHTGIQWRLIGRGQEADRIRAILKDAPVPNITWEEWVPYENLVAEIKKSDICLGIFGDTEKAARVIPNKVFQILAANKPLITADSPAIRELLDDQDYVALVPPADALALCKAVESMMKRIRHAPSLNVKITTREDFSPDAIGKALTRELQAALPQPLK